MEVFFWGKNLRQIEENLRNRFLLFSIKHFLGNYLINKTQIRNYFVDFKFPLICNRLGCLKRLP